MSYNTQLDRLRLLRTSIQREMSVQNLIYSSPDKDG